MKKPVFGLLTLALFATALATTYWWFDPHGEIQYQHIEDGCTDVVWGLPPMATPTFPPRPDGTPAERPPRPRPPYRPWLPRDPASGGRATPTPTPPSRSLEYTLRSYRARALHEPLSALARAGHEPEPVRAVAVFAAMEALAARDPLEAMTVAIERGAPELMGIAAGFWARDDWPAFQAWYAELRDGDARRVIDKTLAFNSLPAPTAP